MAPRILVVDDNPELLSLLVQLLEDAGYEVSRTGRGAQAVDSARTLPPAAAILDVLLPDMMGYQVAEALRKHQPQLPLIFVTGVFKGGKHAAEARQKYAAADYFEKPFDATRLLDAVRRVAPLVESPAEPKPTTGSFDDVELDIDVDEEGFQQDPLELTGFIKVTGDNLSAEIRGANLTAAPMPPTPVIPMVRPPVPPTRPLPARRPSATSTPTVSSTRRGELHDNLPALITAFYLARETGELGLQRGKVKKVVYFERGMPVFALSNLLADRFGQFLVRVGKIKPEQLTEVAAAATASKRRTGDVLVERGLLKDTERLYYVAQQVKSIIYSLFSWEEGSWVMSFKEKATAESIKLDAHPANLIIRGVKKLYKPERLARLLRPEDRLMPAEAPSYPLEDVGLERWEAELLPRIDGTRTLAELFPLAQRPPAAVHGSLVALLSLGLLVRRD